ncbi:hypothetical protein ACSBR2_016977 [Camellia fascicularis]
MEPNLLFTATILFFLLLFPTGKPDLAADRAALLALCSTVGGRSLLWNLFEPTPCSWPSVICDSGRVTELHVPGMGLFSQVPPKTIGNLTSLHTLSLRFNALSSPLHSDLYKHGKAHRTPTSPPTSWKSRVMVSLSQI